MFSRSLLTNDVSRAAKITDPAVPQFRMTDYGFGKQNVRVFQLQKNGPVHLVNEYLVSSHMRLRSHKEYYDADNSDIVGSDVQESSIFVHAQKYGIRTPEDFALSLTKEFLDTYEMANESNIMVEEMGWKRLGEHENQGHYLNKPHNHVFLRNANGRRYCEVARKKGDDRPLVISGINDLRMIKTACAPFTGYVKGTLFTEGDLPDRMLCVDVNAKWQYAKIDGIDFATHWHRVRDIILQSFAGDPVEGIITTSVQYISYTTECAILKAIPEICSASIQVSNYTHLPFDFSRFPAFEKKPNVIISHPKEMPKSIGYAHLDRLESADGNKKSSL